ncbi:unnamed protein product [Dracunculus medinensis]|uniref:Nucleotide-diphospho-sugar transferase domain-containing protein n=1 Tax=Dracunculus medinensis TaxID=318479 RepID=A0A3P7QRJ1_DRAME|nr:unnamed protein product [Dracunculus medinensis]
MVLGASTVISEISLGSHALNLTLNWLCNVATFENVHRRTIIFAFDDYSYGKIKESWPELNDKQFHVGDGRYQMFQLFRSNLCSYLAANGISFWMLQADTYWRENLFDVIGSLLADMIAGGNFFVKAGYRSTAFFNELSRRLLNYYSTDNNIMGALCRTIFKGSRCSFIPYQIISNWRWHTMKDKKLPSLMQFDGGATGISKFKRMQDLGAYFVKSETIGRHQTAKCNANKIREPKNAISMKYFILHHFIIFK